MINAYCGRHSYTAGDTVEVHVSTRSSSFDLKVVRDGADVTHVASFPKIEGRFYPDPPNVVADGCGWPVALSFQVGPGWRSGFYRLELRTPEGGFAETFFVVRARVPTAPILWVIETNTWVAYNSYGGANTYSSQGSTYLGGAPRVSLLRPLPRGFLGVESEMPRLINMQEFEAWRTGGNYDFWCGGASWAARGQVFARWLELEGYDVDYAVSSDLHIPGLLDDYRVMLSVGHDEYWSWEMRDAVESFISRGGHVAFLTGNTAYWQVRLENDGTQMVAYKAAVEQDPVMGTAEERRHTGLWSNAKTKRPENLMTGLSFTRGGYSSIAGAVPEAAGAYTIYRPQHWALAGTGLSYGDALGLEHKVIGYENDGCEFQFHNGLPYPTGRDGTPTNFEIIGLAPSRLFDQETAPEGFYPEGALPDLDLVALQLDGRIDDETLARYRHGHAIMGSYVSPGGGIVFNAGTTDWVQVLQDEQIAQITRNILNRMIVDESGNQASTTEI